MKFLYVCLTYCYVIPAGLLALLLRPFGRRYDIERLGLNLPQLTTKVRPVWLVASSVGEVTIALKVIERLKQAIEAPVILSVTTPTGRARILQSAIQPDAVFFHPFDTTGNVRRTIEHFKPQMVILVETELWPTLMEASFERGIPMAQVSGRLSEKSHRRYRALRPYFAPLIRRCSLLLMQSEADADRLRDIAGETAPIEVVGSIKEDYMPPDSELLNQMKESMADWTDRIVFTCGSTRPDEETILCDAFVRLKKSNLNLRMVIAPRHLERVKEIELILSTRGLSYRLWGSTSQSQEVEVLLLDTIGKLNAVYHLSQIAFVGGTLAPSGGHTLLEPALAGCPVLHGPHYFGQLRGYELLHQFGMGFVVSDSAAVASTIEAIISNKDFQEKYCAKAIQLRNASSHILNEYVERLKSVMLND